MIIGYSYISGDYGGLFLLLWVSFIIESRFFSYNVFWLKFLFPQTLPRNYFPIHRSTHPFFLSLIRVQISTQIIIIKIINKETKRGKIKQEKNQRTCKRNTYICRDAYFHAHRNPVQNTKPEIIIYYLKTYMVF